MAEEVTELKKQLERRESNIRDLDARTCSYMTVMDSCADLIDSKVYSATQQLEGLAISDVVGSMQALSRPLLQYLVYKLGWLYLSINAARSPRS